jgi:glutathione S-transferase
MSLTLYIGNKAYSSWSLRPWILMKQLGIPFEDVVIPLDHATTAMDIQRHSPTGKVPALATDSIVVWETLAIVEFLAERFPDKGVWPVDIRARAIARSISSEMHAGFAALRKACPMNIRRRRSGIELPDEAKSDVERIEAAWAAARADYGQGGPFLFGAFSAADAMFAPVVNRLEVYAVEVRPETKAYMDAVQALPSWQAWVEDARREPWFIDKYEAI